MAETRSSCNGEIGDGVVHCNGDASFVSCSALKWVGEKDP